MRALSTASRCSLFSRLASKSPSFDRLPFGRGDRIEHAGLPGRDFDLLDEREHDRIELQPAIAARLGHRVVAAGRCHGEAQDDYRRTESIHEIVSRVTTIQNNKCDWIASHNSCSHT